MVVFLQYGDVTNIVSICSSQEFPKLSSARTTTTITTTTTTTEIALTAWSIDYMKNNFVHKRHHVNQTKCWWKQVHQFIFVRNEDRIIEDRNNRGKIGLGETLKADIFFTVENIYLGISMHDITFLKNKVFIKGKLQLM